MLIAGISHEARHIKRIKIPAPSSCGGQPLRPALTRADSYVGMAGSDDGGLRAECGYVFARAGSLLFGVFTLDIADVCGRVFGRWKEKLFRTVVICDQETPANDVLCCKGS